MKAFIVSVLFVGFAAIALADEKIDVMAVSKACMAESKANEQEVKDFWEGNGNIDNVTPNLKCQLKCVMEKLGHLKGGAFDADKAANDWKNAGEMKQAKMLDPKSFASCKNEKGENECETAYKIHKCLRQFKA